MGSVVMPPTPPPVSGMKVVIVDVRDTSNQQHSKKQATEQEAEHVASVLTAGRFCTADDDVIAEGR
jgi:hypothetical protein